MVDRVHGLRVVRAADGLSSIIPKPRSLTAEERHRRRLSFSVPQMRVIFRFYFVVTLKTSPNADK